MTTDGRTDQPTNRQSFENIQTVSIQALTMPKQIVFTGHANQGCAELSKNKFKCFLRSTGNLGRSHKSTALAGFATKAVTYISVWGHLWNLFKIRKISSKSNLIEHERKQLHVRGCKIAQLRSKTASSTSETAAGSRQEKRSTSLENDLFEKKKSCIFEAEKHSTSL